jgi:hypothetical protein
MLSFNIGTDHKPIILNKILPLVKKGWQYMAPIATATIVNSKYYAIFEKFFHYL